MAAVRGGVVQAGFEQKAASPVAPNTSMHASQDAPSASTSLSASGGAGPVSIGLPLHRRLGRVAFRLLRPLVLPFLTRFQARITLGLDSSATIARLQQQLDILLAHVQHTGERTHVALEGAGATARRLEQLTTQFSTQLTEMPFGIEALAQRIQISHGHLMRTRDRIVALESLLADRLQKQETNLAHLSGRMDAWEHQQMTRLTALEDQLATLLKKQDLAAADATVHHQSLQDVLKHTQAAEHVSAQTLERAEHLLRARFISLGREVLCRTSYGWLLTPAEDLRLVAAMAERGDALEPGTVAVLSAILSQGEVAVDVGANIGAISLVMASAVGASGKVIAIEPTPRCADLLRRTMALNGVQDFVQIVQAAVSADNGTARLNIGLTSAHNSLLALDESQEAIEVTVWPLDQLVTSGLTPSLVKIDVEGAELDVLHGMSDVLARSPDLALVVEFGPSHLARAGISIDAWLGAFRSQGFTPWVIDEASGTISTLPAEGLEKVFSINLLMLRQPPTHWPRLIVTS